MKFEISLKKDRLNRAEVKVESVSVKQKKPEVILDSPGFFDEGGDDEEYPSLSKIKVYTFTLIIRNLSTQESWEIEASEEEVNTLRLAYKKYDRFTGVYWSVVRSLQVLAKEDSDGWLSAVNASHGRVKSEPMPWWPKMVFQGGTEKEGTSLVEELINS